MMVFNDGISVVVDGEQAYDFTAFEDREVAFDRIFSIWNANSPFASGND
jgi:hypothetical protein